DRQVARRGRRQRSSDHAQAAFGETDRVGAGECSNARLPTTAFGRGTEQIVTSRPHLAAGASRLCPRPDANLELLLMNGITQASEAPARLLIVDDEPLVLTALSEMLSREGYQVVSA